MSNEEVILWEQRWKHHKVVKRLWVLLTLVPILLIILGYIFPSTFFNNQDEIRDWVSGFGIFAPIMFILLQIAQVVITPLSHYAVSLAWGYIFGVWAGFLYNWIGRVIGTIIAFYLGKILGRKILKHVVKESTMKKYDYLFDKGKSLLFLAYFLPIFPDDELSYLAGISAMRGKLFIPLIILGHISGSLSLAYIGNGVKSMAEPMFIIISAVTLLGGILFILYSKKILK